MSAEDTLKAKIIQKAWEDAAFKAQLLADPKAAIQAAFGVAIPAAVELVAVEETMSKYYLVIPPNPSEVLDASASENGMW
ncbi:NHLP leader peptide family RiPP precursor [Paenibacillus contaminans]|uniref:NHLP leader peptide family natural product n=1 Tax=Paenibacillus contaminans TaxID=450362 RepID=A0A329LWZ6_9BACL|nr:NHLP leader peptide family RiPP precursor [Paenibacillus contaminans]RAV11732.1 NHLP leader peptide family natural product precursor [Paenibacillus contaminans]